MDKINKALTATEDNAVMIAELRSAIKKLTGLSFEVRDKTNCSLGIVKAPKGGAAIIAFEGNAVAAGFCNKQVGAGNSPIIAALPPGSGELTLGATRSNVRALILYKS